MYIYIYVIFIFIYIAKEKVGYFWESTREIYQNISPIYELYNGCIGQYGAIFWEQLLGYPPKGTQLFLLNIHISSHLVKLGSSEGSPMLDLACKTYGF